MSNITIIFEFKYIYYSVFSGRENVSMPDMGFRFVTSPLRHNVISWKLMNQWTDTIILKREKLLFRGKNLFVQKSFWIRKCFVKKYLHSEKISQHFKSFTIGVWNMREYFWHWIQKCDLLTELFYLDRNNLSIYKSLWYTTDACLLNSTLQN